MIRWQSLALCAFAMLFALQPVSSESAAATAVGSGPGVCAVLGLPEGGAGPVIELATARGWTVFFQSPEAEDVTAVRRAAEAAGLLGRSIFADTGPWDSVRLADNLADAVIVCSANTNSSEVRRVLRPKGKAVNYRGGRVRGERLKAVPKGMDAWSHPFHGPDNNPLSTDRLARAPYLTQFIADPKFSPLPTITVSAGGRVFRAHGHISFKANQTPVLNTLVCSNGYNGTILWKRSLKQGFMIHRMCMVATEDSLYLADDESCKVLDAATGAVRREIVVPEGISDGPVWKWMALEDGVLYALVGGREVSPAPLRGQAPGIGHWPWSVWEGYGYEDPRTNFGFGRTLLAMDAASGNPRWHQREEEYIDGRGLCMGNGRIYYYSPQKFLACRDARNGELVWKNSDRDLLTAIAPTGRAQNPRQGFSSTNFLKCDKERLYFAGPQRPNVVVASAADGKLLWQRPDGNFHLLLYPDALYGIGAAPGFKADYADGRVLATYPNRRACTRATGSVDAIFYRASGGTVRVDLASDTAQHIAPMRPPCLEGVVVANGMLYWGPWMCGCQLSLYGHIGLASGAGFDYGGDGPKQRLIMGDGDATKAKALSYSEGDWPVYCGDAANRCFRDASMPGRVRRAWSSETPGGTRVSAPVTAGGLVFVADRSGAVRALRADDGKVQWEVYTGGAVFYPPAVWNGRVYVGSADGRVYALEAATGRTLWTFRVAPAERWIAVNGTLISTWPVAGGVVVDDGAATGPGQAVVYAAAGIAHYDGTHVVALDAVTGKVRWYNNSSGATSEEIRSGVSLQGNLYLRDGELCFAGGGVHPVARYDLATGNCRNAPATAPRSTVATAFEAHYPEYGQYMSLDHTFADGSTLSCQNTYDGAGSSSLALFRPLPPGQTPPPNWRIRRGRGQPFQRESIWDRRGRVLLNAFIVTPDAALLATRGRSGDAGLTAVRVKDGSDLWEMELAAPAVRGGLAIDGSGRIFASLQDGTVLCLVGGS
ncbi:MAG: PQQ-binding-like beta-propeller repeat protein [Armatimonadota bacterium]